ncbi:MAG: hypothetical protein JKY15_07400 [Deltaproteobacteria bacterium]|nr:hypothetical protein [Deltaproteobacteria bacterium]
MFRIFLFLSLALTLTTCDSGGSGSLGGIFATTTCTKGDLNCYLANIVVQDDSDNNISLVTLNRTLAATTQDSLPSITKGPSDVNIFQGRVYSATITWNDPLAKRPAFCLTLCSAGAGCTTQSRCIRSVPDGLVTGTFKTFLGYNATPEGSANTFDEFDVEIWPISSPKGSDGPIGILTGTPDKDPPPNPVHIGQKFKFKHKVFASGSSSLGTGGTGGSGTGGGTVSGSCTSHSDCGSSQRCISARNCVGISCSCSGSTQSGACATVSKCGNAGTVCGNGVDVCCFGHTCNNGKCESNTTGKCAP